MAAGTWTPYGPAKEALGKAAIRFDGGHVLKMALLKDTYTPDATNHDQLSDLTAHELSGNGYSRFTLDPTWSRTGTVTKFSAASNAVFQAIGGDLDDIKYAVIFDDDHADDIPICYLDLNDGGGAIAAVAEDTALRVSAPANGFLQG